MSYTRNDTPMGYSAPQVTVLLQQLRSIIDAARPVPLSASSMINKEEVLSIIDQVGMRLPDELRSASWLLKERDEFLSHVQGEGDEILAHAQAQAEQMVQETELVKMADQRAKHIMQQAHDESRRLRRQTEDFCDQRLASFEASLEKTLQVVASGRARLRSNALDNLDSGDTAPPTDLQQRRQTGAHRQINGASDSPEVEDRFFDQGVS